MTIPTGSEVTRDDKTVMFRKKCIQCGATTVIIMDTEKYDRWQAGEHIQNVLPELTTMQRETIISGVCSDKCWDDLFGVE